MKGYSGESRFYFGTDLYNHLRDLIEGATKIDVATAWVTDSDALKLLVSKAQQRSATVRIVAGVGLFATDPAVLKKLGATVGIELRIYGGLEPPLFHPKLYMFRCQHGQRVLVGSMNFTGSGTTKNIESIFSFEDKMLTADREFERFWESPVAIRFEDFDLKSYAASRRAILTAVKNVGAVDILEADVVATAENRLQVDALREGWKEYVSELTSLSDETLEDYRTVLNVRKRLVERDWHQDLDATERKIFFGISPYYAFGNLTTLARNKRHFEGPENLEARLQIGEALNKALSLQSFQRPMIEDIVKQLLHVPYCGPALATRLLVLTRPDLFVIVNEKSFSKLSKRFDVAISDVQFTARTYVDLLEKIRREKWFQSQEPDDPSERELWMARAALLDPLVTDFT